MNKELPLVISFSGGRTSAYMAWWINQNYPGKEKVFVFANTGKEKEATLEFVNECDKRWKLDVIWVEALVNPEMRKATTFKVVNFETASRKGEPFEAVIEKYGISNVAYPHCSRELKIRPIEDFADTIYPMGYMQVLGFRIDEAHRAKQVLGKWYPFCTTFKVNKEMVRNWWDQQPFDLQIKDYEGNCDLCWKKSKRKLLTILNTDPSIADWYIQMEQKYGADDQFVFFRENKSASDLVMLATTTKFRKAMDEHAVNRLAPELNFDKEMDQEAGCACGEE